MVLIVLRTTERYGSSPKDVQPPCHAVECSVSLDPALQGVGCARCYRRRMISVAVHIRRIWVIKRSPLAIEFAAGGIAHAAWIIAAHVPDSGMAGG